MNPSEQGLGPELGGLLSPQAPHDALGFLGLARSYNFLRTSDRRRVFVRLLHEEFSRRTRPLRVLDVGCGEGMGEDESKIDYLQAVAAEVHELWGVEPDRSIRPDHGLFTQFRSGTLETADLPEAYFDIAYAFFVMEHVSEPDEFMRRLSRLLKPGGCFFFITPNARHYFVRAARMLKAARLSDWYLRHAKGSDLVEEYHYPVVYRLNSERAIRDAAERAGLDVRGFAYTEGGVSRDYFWGPTVVLDWLARRKRLLIHDPGCLLELIGCLDKPGL